MSQAQVFQAFNEQLACITDAGVPMDEGLRLIAKETRSRRARRAIEQIAADLENGEDLSAAFARQGGSFPELYHQVIEVGVKSGRMSHVLIAFGRHLVMMQRFRNQLARSLAYPVVCLVMLLLVASFLAAGPIPMLMGMTGDTQPLRRFGQAPAAPRTPIVVEMVSTLAPAVPWVCGAILLILILVPIVMWVLTFMGGRAAFTDAVLFRVPLLGRVLRTAAMARWCDAMAICADAGLPMSQSLTLAGDLVGYPSFRADSLDMVDALVAGQPLQHEQRWRQVTLATRMALQLASERHDLPGACRALAEMCQYQAEARAVALGAVLSPALLIIIATMVAITLGALMFPLVQFLRGV